MMSGIPNVIRCAGRRMTVTDPFGIRQCPRARGQAGRTGRPAPARREHPEPQGGACRDVTAPAALPSARPAPAGAPRSPSAATHRGVHRTEAGGTPYGAGRHPWLPMPGEPHDRVVVVGQQLAGDEVRIGECTYGGRQPPRRGGGVEPGGRPRCRLRGQSGRRTGPSVALACTVSHPPSLNSRGPGRLRRRGRAERAAAGVAAPTCG
jgi:hypothetical protein